MLLTVVASSTTAAEFAAVNASRQGLVVSNSDANDLYVLLGPGTASASNHSFVLGENENAGLANCRERVSGVWAGDGSGSAMVTEY